MKKYRMIIDLDTGEESTEEVDATMDRIWLDTGTMMIELPEEILDYLEDSYVLGIA